jgi:hypothetical protein
MGPAGTATVIVSDSPPAGAADSTLWYESDSGLLYFRYNDGTSTQWVIAAPQPDITQFLVKGGDTMSGDLTISKADPSLILNEASGGARISGRKSGVDRWNIIPGDGAIEGGSNSGNDFRIRRFSDAGVGLDDPFIINRAT